VSTILRAFAFAFFASVSLGFSGLAIAQATIFADDLDDNAAGWTFESLTGNFGINGSDSIFGFDYAALGIPEAPNSNLGDAATRGLRIRTNNTGLSTDQAAAFLENPDFSGKYTVQVDIWLNWSADENQVGTTEHGGLYVGHSTTEHPAPANKPVQQGAGAIVSTDGDCSNCDYILLKNQYEMDTFSGQYSVRDFGFGNQPGFDNTDLNTNPANGALLDLPALFPAFNISDATGGMQGTPTDIEQTVGAVGFQWITMTAEVDPTAAGLGPGPGVGTAKFTIKNAATGESFVLGTVDNSRPDILDDDMDGDNCQSTSEDPASEDICVNNDNPLDGDFPVDLEGQISLFLVDFFNGPPSDLNLGFALFDNVLVFETPTGLPGDYNENGIVDAADYTVWRDHLGQTFDLPNENPDDAMPGLVDVADYEFWVSQFGISQAAGSGNVASASVPEPSGLFVLVLGGLTVLLTTCRAIRCRPYTADRLVICVAKQAVL
jgi:hypothetical protein